MQEFHRLLTRPDQLYCSVMCTLVMRARSQDVGENRKIDTWEGHLCGLGVTALGMVETRPCQLRRGMKVNSFPPALMPNLVMICHHCGSGDVIVRDCTADVSVHIAHHHAVHLQVLGIAHVGGSPVDTMGAMRRVYTFHSIHPKLRTTETGRIELIGVLNCVLEQHHDTETR